MACQMEGKKLVTSVLIGIVMIVLTVAIFLFMRKVYERFTTPLLTPILTSTVCIVLLLLFFNISYETYMIGGQVIDYLLGPAVVALAYPLYRQRHILIAQWLPMVGGIVIGSVIGILSGLWSAQALGVADEIVLSLVPKSVTTPIAQEIAAELGGWPSLAAVFVMIAGIGGAVIAPYVFRWCRLHSDLGRGIGLGSAAHGIGTAKALEYGERTAAVSSIAMTLSAIAASVLAPILIFLLYR